MNESLKEIWENISQQWKKIKINSSRPQSRKESLTKTKTEVKLEIKTLGT